MDRSRGSIVIWVVAAGLAVLAGMRLLDGGGGAAPPVRIDEPAESRGGGRSGRRSGEGLYVHVAGAVRRPGLYRVPPASRVAAAIRLAGGFARGADTTAVNLAAELEDGQQVVVPKARAAAAGPGDPNAPLNLATATADQLDEIDGIGPTLAERIVEHRDAAGGLASVEDLREVEGIGEKRFETLREALGP